MVRELTDQNFNEETGSGLALTDFWATWCGPCRMQSPIIDALDEEADGSVNYFKMDVDENKETPGKFGVMSIPTLLVTKDGEVVDKLIGYHSKEQIEAALAKHK